MKLQRFVGTGVSHRQWSQDGAGVGNHRGQTERLGKESKSRISQELSGTDGRVNKVQGRDLASVTHKRTVHVPWIVSIRALRCCSRRGAFTIVHICRTTQLGQKITYQNNKFRSVFECDHPNFHDNVCYLTTMNSLALLL